jgi:hypothetical protein
MHLGREACSHAWFAVAETADLRLGNVCESVKKEKPALEKRKWTGRRRRTRPSPFLIVNVNNTQK